MAYLADSYTDKERIKKENDKWAEFETALLEEADRMEWWASSFEDSGPDWNEWRIFSGEKFLASRRKEGF